MLANPAYLLELITSILLKELLTHALMIIMCIWVRNFGRHLLYYELWGKPRNQKKLKVRKTAETEKRPKSPKNGPKYLGILLPSVIRTQGPMDLW